MDLCFFHAEPADGGSSAEILRPTDLARSLWSSEQLHGVAVSGALARGMERAITRTDLRPARWTVDLFAPALAEPSTVETSILREGRRLVLAESRFMQGGEVRARATGVWLLATEDPDGEVWRSDDEPLPPPVDAVPVLDAPTVPWFSSEADWSQDFTAHQNAGRHHTWTYGVPVVCGEEPTAFESVAAIADSASMVCNWGSKGVQYINSDITLSMSRLPRSPEIGLRAERWSGQDGIAVGVATVHDRDGVIGHAMVTALSNSRRTVDFDERGFGEQERTPRA